MAIRISGFYTGLDIDQLVRDLMQARRAPLDRLLQKKTLIEWQREQYREANAKLVDFRNNKLFNFGLEANIKARKAIVTGDASAVSAKALAGANAGSLTIKVKTLATAATAKSSGTVSDSAKKKLTELSYLDPETNEVTTLPVDTGKNTITIQINDVSISVEKDATIEDLVSAINASDAGVEAFFDEVSGRMSLTAKKTGAGAISLSQEFEKVFRLTDKTNGQSAELEINGISTTRDSNTFTVNGVEITLYGAGTVNIQIGSDVDKIVETIKSFINEYNAVVDYLNKKLSEERFRNYAPLTSAQKEEMTEKEIELWEEKAKSGLLRRDSTLTTLLNDMRLALYTAVDVGGGTISLHQLGIETGTWEQKGKLVIKDEAKLRAAIEADPDKVAALFTQLSSATDEKVKKSPTNPDSGLFQRLSNAIMTALDQLATKAGTSRYSADTNVSFNPSSLMGEELRQLELRIAQMNQRLTQIELRYYKQFTAMEVAVNRFNAQSGSLSSFWS